MTHPKLNYLYGSSLKRKEVLEQLPYSSKEEKIARKFTEAIFEEFLKSSGEAFDRHDGFYFIEITSKEKEPEMYVYENMTSDGKANNCTEKNREENECLFLLKYMIDNSLEEIEIVHSGLIHITDSFLKKNEKEISITNSRDISMERFIDITTLINSTASKGKTSVKIFSGSVSFKGSSEQKTEIVTYEYLKAYWFGKWFKLK